MPRAAEPFQPIRPGDAGAAAIAVVEAPSAARMDEAAGVPASAVYRHPQADREIAFGALQVAYRLRRARRRSIGFVVGVDGLSVNAPTWVALRDIESALHAKAGWIVRKLAEQRERQHRVAAARIDWAHGSRLPYLGGVLVVALDGTRRGAHLEPPTDGDATQTLRIGLPAASTPEQVRTAVRSWLQREARRVFEARCQHYGPQLGVRWTRLSLSSAATRWGSASSSGAIRLNWRLVHFGLETIDYVVAHELAHLREMNHSPRFWAVVRSVIPDYESARRQLRSDVLPVLD